MAEGKKPRKARRVRMVQVQFQGTVFQGSRASWIRFNQAIVRGEADGKDGGALLLEHKFRAVAPLGDVDITEWSRDDAIRVLADDR